MQIEKPVIVSSSPSEVTLGSACDGARIAFRISKETIEQAFQVTGSKEDQLRTLIESNMDEIWKIAARRYEAARLSAAEATAADGAKIELGAADLETMPMHIQSAGNATRSW